MPETQLRGGPFDGLKVHLVASDLCFFGVYDITSNKFAFYSRTEAAQAVGDDFHHTTPIAGAMGGFLILKR